MKTLTAMLKNLNYQVITAINGQTALAAYQESKAEIVLVLSDMVMPDIGRETLFYILKKQTPDIKMILMSGYPLGEKGAKLLEQGLVDWFQKPISFGQLSQAIENLDSGHPVNNNNKLPSKIPCVVAD